MVIACGPRGANIAWSDSSNYRVHRVRTPSNTDSLGAIREFDVCGESYQRIFRDNLVRMGVLPLQFRDGDSRESLGLDGSETSEIRGLDDGLAVNDDLAVVARRDDGSTVEFPVSARVNTPAAVEYVEHGGILHYVLRRLLSE